MLLIFFFLTLNTCLLVSLFTFLTWLNLPNTRFSYLWVQGKVGAGLVGDLVLAGMGGLVYHRGPASLLPSEKAFGTRGEHWHVFGLQCNHDTALLFMMTQLLAQHCHHKRPSQMVSEIQHIQKRTLNITLIL